MLSFDFLEIVPKNALFYLAGFAFCSNRGKSLWSTRLTVPVVALQIICDNNWEKWVFLVLLCATYSDMSSLSVSKIYAD
jgi:hypothetical protein